MTWLAMLDTLPTLETWTRIERRAGLVPHPRFFLTEVPAETLAAFEPFLAS